MIDFIREIELAENEYSSGQFELSLERFERLAEYCHIEDHYNLSKIFYHIGNILMELGYQDQAIDSWKSSLRINPEGDIHSKVMNCINQYGMHKNRNSGEDDFKAFASIQISKYLKNKVNPRFGNLAEADVVMELIFESWRELSSQLNLSQIRCHRKIPLFEKYRIDFPIYEVVEQFCEIEFNFKLKRRVKPSDECNCGSHLPYYACCGAIKEPNRLLDGLN